MDERPVPGASGKYNRKNLCVPNFSPLARFALPTTTPRPANMATTAHTFAVKSIKGADMPFADLAKGKVTLVVNVASACGFTPQYKGLQEVYEKYKDKGFTVVGFPCNQFGAQESKPEAEIETFVCDRFKVSFPMTAKVDVNGDGAHPLWKWMKHEKPGLLGTEGIKWNFSKFLLDKEGRVVERYAPTSTPESIAKDIEKLL